MVSKIEQTETIKYLSDHIKSVWTLSAGALAFGLGILGFISKEPVNPNWLLVVGQSAVALCLIPYLISVIKGLQSHQNLIEALTMSEASGQKRVDPNQTDEQRQKDANAQRQRLKESLRNVREGLRCAKNAFILGGFSLVVCTLIFIVLTAVFKKDNATDLDITLKKIIVVTNSRTVEFENITLRVLEVSPSLHGRKHYEIENIILKERIAEPKP